MTQVPCTFDPQSGTPLQASVDDGINAHDEHRDGQTIWEEHTTNRRQFMTTALTVGGSVFAPLAPSASAASETNVFSDKNFSVEDAKKRFRDARTDLRFLQDNYSEISKNGGDAVRNYLGTQGINSNMYGIQKVLKLLQTESDDIVEYTEAMDEFNAYYYQAEGAAYQSLFAQHSSAKSTPESLLATAQKDIQQN